MSEIDKLAQTAHGSSSCTDCLTEWHPTEIRMFANLIIDWCIDICDDVGQNAKVARLETMDFKEKNLIAREEMTADYISKAIKRKFYGKTENVE